jgi:hypothetical protein
VSSPKPEAKKSVEQQVKAGLRAVRDFLAGHSGDATVAATEDRAIRDVVAAELLAKMSGRAAGEAAGTETAGASQTNTEEITSHNEKGTSEQTKQQEYLRNPSEAGQERERARELFLDHGYFDEAVEALRTASSPAERAAAARALGLVGSQRGAAHLVAAMFDDNPEVRSAAEEALERIGEPKLADIKVDVDAVFNRETERVAEVESTTLELAQDGWEKERAPWEDLIASAKSDMAQQVGPDVRPSEELESPVQQSSAAQTVAAEMIATKSFTTAEEEQLLLEEHRIRESAEDLSRQLLEIGAARKQSEQEVQSRIEREAGLRAEAAARRTEEEELRKRADEEAERHRVEEREALTAEQLARAHVEAEAKRLAEEEIRVRLQAVDLRLAAAEFASQRMASEASRRDAAEAARQAEAQRTRDEAKARHDAELARLHSEEEALRTRADEIALRRAEVEAAREQADAEAERLVEALARMRAAAAAAAEAEEERARLEAEINQRMETALRLLQETRRREQEEHERLQEETRFQAEEQRHRLAESELMKTRAEAESRQLAEKEQQILNQINSLRFVDAETRKRIEDAEVRRHASEEAYRLVAEKVQRVEAEAHARAKEEEQMLAKLETERRTVAVEAQSRTAQEKRIREEIEMFHRLEEQERPRLEAATLQRKEAEARLQQLRERLKAEVAVRVSTEKKLNVAAQYKGIAANHPAANREGEHRPGNLTQAEFADTEAAKAFTEGSAAVSEKDATTTGGVEVADDVDTMAASSVTPSIFAYLNSVDPYKRAAAVAELARSGSQDAFSLIANCFDDHSPHVRNAAARAFRKLEPNRTVDLFNRALENASAERRRNIGAAIAASGLATEAINNLISDNREQTYSALSMLFVMAKTGEVELLERALEEHPNDGIGKAVAKLLTLSGHSSQ